MRRSRSSLPLTLLTAVLLSTSCSRGGSRPCVPVPPAPIVVTPAPPDCLRPGPQPEPPLSLGARLDPATMLWSVPDRAMVALLAYHAHAWAWADRAEAVIECLTARPAVEP